MDFPAGCYSDDTQLRLATSRAVTSRGFDVEAFAKVELPAWPAYALGGGRASKAAAVNLSKSAVPWFGNFYTGYTNAGGNGAAMRIQPHVWAAAPGSDEFVVDILRNSITTHGHPRALVGAVLSGQTLMTTLLKGRVPSPTDWPFLLDQVADGRRLLDRDSQLGLWRQVWQQQTEASFDELWSETVDECRTMLELIEPVVSSVAIPDEGCGRSAYSRIVELLGLSDPESRGSGTATVCAALAVAAALPNDAYLASVIPGTTLGTDTDTIATMAAAIVGAVASDDPPGELQDRGYHRQEAERLWTLHDRHGGNGPSGTTDFAYPDLLKWSPPRSQIETVGLVDGDLAVSGLALLATDRSTKPVVGKDAVWLWTRTDFGQSMLVKTRQEPRPLPKGRIPPTQRYISRESTPGQETTNLERAPVLSSSGDVDPFDVPDLFTSSTDDHESDSSRSGGPEGTGVDAEAAGDARRSQAPRIDVDEMLRWLWARNLEDRDLGYAMRRLAESGTIEQHIAFTTAIRAMVEQRRRQRDAGS